MANILMDKYRYAPPLAAQFPTLHNGGLSNPTLTDTVGSGLVLDFGTDATSSFFIKAATKAKAAGDHSIIARVQFGGLYNFMRAGIVLTDGTKVVSFAFGPTAAVGFGVQLDTWNTFAGSFNASQVDNFPVSPMCEWLRVDIVSGHPKDFFWSHNGREWLQCWGTTMSGFLTFTRVGIECAAMRSGASSFPLASTNHLSVDCLYFKDGDINPGF